MDIKKYYNMYFFTHESIEKRDISELFLSVPKLLTEGGTTSALHS